MAFGNREHKPAGSLRPEFQGAPSLEDAIRQLREASAQMAAQPALPPSPTGFSASLDNDLAAKAGLAVLSLLCDGYRNSRGCHLETLMGGLAALAGEFALRAGVESRGISQPNWVEAARQRMADPFVFGTRAGVTSLWSFVCFGALQINAAAERLPDPAHIVARVEVALANPRPFMLCPGVPEGNAPHEWSANACPRYRDDVVAIMSQHGIFDAEETAYALGFAMTALFKWGVEAITPDRLSAETLATLAAEVMTATSRMAPLEAEVR